MISVPLFKRTMFSSLKFFIVCLAILTMYVSMIIYMFDPKLADTLAKYQEMMPGVMAAVGMTGLGTTLISFIHTYLYGFIMLLIPMTFTIIITNKSLMKYVNTGSMACLLATPNSRLKIIMTQLFSIILSITLLLTSITIIGYFCSELMFKGALDLPKYIQLNISNYLLQLAISSIAFFAACVFNESKNYFFFGAGLPFLFYVIQMMANMGGHLKPLKYITLFTLFAGNQIIAGDSGILIKNVVLCCIALFLYTGGAIYFTKKDLPL